MTCVSGREDPDKGRGGRRCAKKNRSPLVLLHLLQAATNPSILNGSEASLASGVT